MFTAATVDASPDSVRPPNTSVLAAAIASCPFRPAITNRDDAGSLGFGTTAKVGPFSGGSTTPAGRSVPVMTSTALPSLGASVTTGKLAPR